MPIINSNVKYHQNKKNRFIKLVIILLSFFIVIFFFVNQLTQRAPKKQPSEKIGELKNYEAKLVENWANIEALLYTARQYYILAKEDDVFLSYLKSSEDIPEKFYIKTLYKLEKLGYQNIAFLQEKFKEKSQDLKSVFIRSLNMIIDDMYEKSLINYRKVEALSKKLLSAKDYYYIGMIYYKKGEFYANASIDYFNKALDMGLKEAEVYLALSNSYYMLNQIDEGLKYLQKADSKISGFNPVIRYNIVWYLYSKKKYKEALDACEASIIHLKKVIDKAKSEEIKITDKNIYDNTLPLYSPHHLIKFYRLKAKIYTAQNNYEEALAILREAEKIADTDENLNVQIAETLFYQNRLDDAKFYLNKVLTKNPENQDALELSSKMKK
ncbi:MAG TPA: tetratricopeptide repeat protein [bacterium]|nr:tetratricopeptide repeat protein [bacterium]HPP86764.1 tetratricopeptide repeat protein [bacterium]